MSRRALVFALWLSATGAAIGLVATAVHMAMIGVSVPVSGSSAVAPSVDGPHARGGADAARSLTQDGDPTSPAARLPGQPASRAAGRHLDAHGATAPASAHPASSGGGASKVKPATSSTRSPATTSPAAPSGAAPASTTTTVGPGSASSVSSTTTTGSTTTTSPPQVYSYRVRGGSVGVRCNDSDVSLAYATPDDGYSVTVDETGPSEVQVRFTEGSWTTIFRAVCSNGQPQTSVSGGDA